MKINKNNHIFLLIEKKYSDIENTISNIFCSYVDDEYSKEKISNRTYYDFEDIDSQEENIKQRLSDIKLKFENKSIETSGYKFYVIRNIEKLSKASINSLLKFIEEPPKNTIGILTTRNNNMVLDTIKSRCEEIVVHSSKELFENFISENKITDKVDFYYEGFYNIPDISKYSDGELEEMTMISSYLQSDFSYNNELLDILKLFKKLDYNKITIVLNSLKSVLNSTKYYELLKLIENLKYNPNKNLVFYSLIKILKGEIDANNNITSHSKI